MATEEEWLAGFDTEADQAGDVTTEVKPQEIPQDWVAGFGDEEEDEVVDFVDEEPVRANESEPFWHPWVRQATATYLTRHKPAAEIIQRSAVRTAEDLYNVVNEQLPIGDGKVARWEEEWLGDPKSAVVDISADIGSWLTSFFGPGTLFAKGLTLPAQLPKIKKGLDVLKGSVEATKYGKQLINFTRIASQGFARGVVADYVRTDVDDLDAKQAVEKRVEELYLGAALGIGVNLGLAGLQRLVRAGVNKIDALREVRKASEGKADPEQALRDLKDAVEEENAIKQDISEQINPRENDLKIDFDELGDKGQAIKALEEGPYSEAKEIVDTSGLTDDFIYFSHATSSDAVKNILKNGFDLKYSGGDLETNVLVHGTPDNLLERLAKIKEGTDVHSAAGNSAVVFKIPKDEFVKGFRDGGIADATIDQGTTIVPNKYIAGYSIGQDVQKGLPPAPQKITPEGKVEEVVPAPRVDPADEVFQFIQGQRNYPLQVQAMVQETIKLSQRLTPKVNSLVEDISKLDNAVLKESNVDVGKSFDEIKSKIITLEDDLLRNRKLIDIRAKVGNFAGRLLAGFRKKEVVDLTKPFEYKPEVRKQLDNIDTLLNLIKSVKTGTNYGQDIVKRLRTELSLLDEVAETGNLAAALDKQFNLTAESSLKTIWGNYKQRISKQVIKELRTKEPTNKAALELFSNRVTSTLNGALKGNKKVANKVKTALADVQDIVKNPGKYRESINQIISDITKAKDIPADEVNRSLRILEDLKEGVNSQRFIDSLPNRGKIVEKILREEVDNIGNKIRAAVNSGTEKQLVDDVMSDLSGKIKELSQSEKDILLNTIRVELANTVASVRDSILGNFKSKELYKQYSLKAQIRELDEMADKSIAEIKEYLKVNARKAQVDPEGIKELKTEVRQSRKVLTDILKNEEIAAKNEFNKEFLKAFQAMGRHGTEGINNIELSIRALETYRMNTGLLMGFRTFLVGLPSGIINLTLQPLETALKTLLKTKNLQKINRFNREVKAHKLAIAEIAAVKSYFSSFVDALRVAKNTLKYGEEGSFMPQIMRRHEEDLTSVLDSVKAKEKPYTINFKNKKELEKMVKAYGVDNPENATLFRRFLEDVALGEASTRLSKLTRPLFDLSFRAMQIPDQAMIFLGYMRNQDAFFTKQGIENGLSGRQLQEFVKDGLDKAVVRTDDGLIRAAQLEGQQDIEQLSRMITFQQEYADKYVSQFAKGFADWSRGGGRGGPDFLSRFDDPYMNPSKIAARWLSMFIKTPTAVAQWSVDKFPITRGTHLGLMALGGVTKNTVGTNTQRAIRSLEKSIKDIDNALTIKPITKDAKDDFFRQRADLVKTKEDLILKQAEIRAEAVTDFFLGTTLLVGITHWLAAGRITGSGAHLSREQRDRLIKGEAAWKPNHIYVEWDGELKAIDYSRLEPLSTILSSYVDMIHHLEFSQEDPTDDDVNMFNVMLTSLIYNFKNKYFLRGLSDFMDLFNPNTPEGKWESFAASQVGTLLPRPISEFNKINQEYAEYAIGFQEKVRLRSGRTNQRIERNLFGEKVSRIYGQKGLWGMVNPIYVTDVKDDSVMGEITNFREPVGKQDFYRKRGLKGDIDLRKFRNKSNQYPLFQAYADLISSKKKEVEIDGRVYNTTLRGAIRRLIRTKEYRDAITAGEVLEGEVSKIDLISGYIDEYRSHFWNQMKEDRRYNNYVDEDGVSWKNFVRIEGVKERRRKRTERTKGMEELMLPALD